MKPTKAMRPEDYNRILLGIAKMEGVEKLLANPEIHNTASDVYYDQVWERYHKEIATEQTREKEAK